MHERSPVAAAVSVAITVAAVSDRRNFYHKPLTMHELNSCSGGCVSRAVACLLANAFGAVADCAAPSLRSEAREG